MKFPSRTDVKSHGLPLILAILCSLATLLVWHRFQQFEQEQIQQVTQSDAFAIRVAIANGIESQIMALDRMAHRWESGLGTSRSGWETDATAYLEDYPSLQSLQWLDSSGNVRWSLVRPNFRAAEGESQAKRQLRETLESAQNSKQIQLSPIIPLSRGDHGFWVCVPLHPAGQFNGFLLNTFSAERLFDSLLTEVGFKQSKYQIAVFHNTQLIYQFIPTSENVRPNDLKDHHQRWTERSRITLHHNEWQLEVTPMPTWIAQLHSYLSETILVGGFIVTAILVCLVYVTQSKTLSNRKLEQRVRERATALRESEQRFRAILENTTSIVYLKDRRGRYLLVNQQFLEIFNLAESEVIGKRDYELFPQRIAEAFIANDRHVFKTGVVLKVEEEAQLANGERRSYISIKAPLCNKSGRPYAICGISTDITEQKQTETQLRDSQELLRLFVDRVPSAIAMFDTQMRYLAVSRRWLSDYNLGEETIIGRSCYEVFPEIPEQWKESHNRALKGTVVKSEEDVLLRADGTRDWVRYEVHPWYKHTGEIGGLIMFAEVITARKQAELALRESEERFRTLADNAPVLIWMSAANQQRTYCNQPWLNFTGRTLDQELGNGWLERVHPEELKFCWETHTTCFESRFPFQIEYRLQRYDSEYSWVLDTGIPRFNADGEFVGYIGSCIFITERKQAQLELERLNQTLEERVRERTAQLQKSEAKFRNLVEASQDLIWSVDAQGRFTFVNPATRLIYGYEPEEILGRPFSELIVPEYRDRDLTIFKRLMSGEIKSLFQYETAHRAKDGRQIALLFNAIPVRDESGTIIGTTGTATNITQRQQAEERLRILERAIDASKSGILVTDPQAPDNPIVYVNSGFEKLTGYSAAEAVGRNCRFLHDSSAEQAGLWELRQAIREGRDCCVILQNYRKDGTTFWNQLTISPVRDRLGRVAHFVGVQVDVSDRLAIEEALKRNEALLLAINQVLPLGIYVANYQRDRILFYNQQFCRLWQLENLEAQLESGNLSNQDILNHCLDKIKATDCIATAQPLAIHGNLSALEDEVPLQDGRILRRLQVLVQDSERQFGHLSVFEDISDRKRAELELQQLNQQLLHSNAELERARENAEAANRAKSDFLAKMTHELRTPMNAILGFTQVLVRDSNLNETQQQQLEIIASSGEHLLGLINDILDMSKIEAGRLELNPTNFDLHNLIDSLKQLLQLKANIKGLQLHLKQEPDVPQFICADRKKLHQILINLLGNAIKFTNKGSVTLHVSVISNSEKPTKHPNNPPPQNPSVAPPLVTLKHTQPTLKSVTQTLHFEVRDTGRGIAPEELEFLFEAFTQSEAGRLAQEEGTGLGLTISKCFVELMGGHIQIDSTLGVGTSVRFAIAIEVAQTEEIEQHRPRKRIVGLAPEQAHYCILIVEDHWENRQLVLQLLSPLGFTVLEATNGRQGIEMWEHHNPQLILIDLQMPTMDGYEAIRQIKATLKGQKTAIIALTASAFDQERKQILAVGCDDYMRKPFDAEELLEKIGYYLGAQYIYETNEPPALNQLPSRPGQLSSEALLVMPRQWREALYEAATACNSKAIQQLLSTIPVEYRFLQRELTGLAKDYRFNAIAEMAQPT